LCGRNSDGRIFAHSKFGKYLETHLGIPEDKQFLETSCLAPHVIVRDVAFPLNTYSMTMRRVSSIIGFPEPGEWWKMHLEY
jgi:hypothetical protein